MLTRFSSKTLSASLAMLLMGTMMAAATSTPSSAIDHWPGDGRSRDEYLGKPLAWPQDRTGVATGKPRTFERVRLLTQDNRPTRELKVVPLVKLPTGSFIYYDSNLRDWILYLPTTYAIPRTHIYYNIIDRDGKWSRAGHIVEVTQTYQHHKPVEDLPSQPNRGPEVEFTGASFTIGEEYEIMVRVQDPESDALKETLLRAPKGFKLEHFDDINWKLIITPQVEPGLHQVGIQAVDTHGNRGTEVFANIEMLKPGEKPKHYPIGPGLPTSPQHTPGTGDTPATDTGFRTAPPATSQPTPAPQGPVVTFSGGTFRNNKEHVIPFRVSDPAGNGVATLYWDAIAGFTVRYVHGDKWELVIPKGATPKTYTFTMQGEDVNGKTGKEITATITITK